MVQNRTTTNTSNRAALKDAAECEILAAYDSWSAEIQRLDGTPTVPAFVARYNRGAVKVSRECLDAFPSLSRATILRWLANRRDGRQRPRLGNYGNRRGTGIIDQDAALRSAIIDLAELDPEMPARRILESLDASQFQTLPSVRTLSRFLTDYAASKGLARRHLVRRS